MEPHFWKDKWQNNQTPWDMEKAHPILMEGFQFLYNSKLLKDGFSAAIPACGSCHDGVELAKKHPKSSVLGYDIEPLAIQKAKEHSLENTNLKLEVIDHFNLSSDLKNKFDLILDRAAMCAFPPKQQMSFLLNSLSLLKPGGFLISAPFINLTLTDKQGPPFALAPSVLKKMLSEDFRAVYYRTIEDHSASKVILKEALVAVQKVS